jgi:hypothetical protein
MATIRERIENTDFDGVMSVEREDLFVARDSGPIVHQNTHAHAAIGRAASRNASSVSMRRSWLDTSPSDTREWTANHETQC